MSSLSRSIIETTLKDDFDIKRFRDFINEMFNGFSFNELSLTHQLNETERNHVKNFTFHGSFRDVKDEAIDVLTVELQTGFKIDRARNFQRNLIGKYLKANIEGVNNAIVAFYSSDDENWRLSFVEIDRKITEKGVKTEVETPPKRFSFLVGKSEPSHTAQKQFIDVLAIQTKENLLVDTIRKAFSVEKVTKEFYIEIAKLFTDLVGGERKINNQTFSSPGLIKYPGNNDTEKKEFAVRLIGRLLFCWFLKKKKSSNKLPLLTDEILSSDSCLQSHDYYHEILEPLFFEVLNTPINDRLSNYKQGFWLNVPFLNGGLFEPHIKDHYELDNVLGKSKALNTLKVPNEWLIKLLKLFELYNFTIDESASIDIDLAIDPEMLGRVFENLLAEINPETGETARKQTGSFYTPRPIVEYMVDESLIAYLEQKLGEKVEQTFLSVNSSNITQTGMSELPQKDVEQTFLSVNSTELPQNVNSTNIAQTGMSELPQKDVEQTFLSVNSTELPQKVNSTNIAQTGMSELPLSYKLRKLISYSDEEHDFSVEEVNLIIDALDKVKILDPACGSGAFPMGVLQKIQLILEKIDPKGEMWLEKVLKDIKEQSVRKMLERKLRGEKELVNFTRKLGIIQKSIYGVDIQEIAIEISKLRCFLSIIVDEKVNDNEENRGIQPLPNLEFKFVAANTLIALPKINWGIQLFNIDAQLAELREYRDEFFQSWGKAKLIAEQNFKEAHTKIAHSLFNDKNIDKEMFDFGTKLADWDPFKNETASWFDPEWMFGVKDGFDIVIGNPPYISTKGVNENDKKILEEKFGFADDIYNHFYFKGIEFLKVNGSLAYISSKTFWTIQTKKNLRELLLKNQLLQLVDTANPFESAMVDTCITIVKKSNNDNNIMFFIDAKNNFDIKQVYKVSTSIFNNVVNNVFFIPNDFNLRVYEKLGKPLKQLMDKWWNFISTSKNIEKNKKKLDEYRNNLKPGDITLLGLITDGGVGLQTGNNGKYVGVLLGTKYAEKVKQDRPKKLWEFIQSKNPKELSHLKNKNDVEIYLNGLSEIEIRNLFDKLKEKYGRDIFGQGWLYRIVTKDEIADVDTLTEDEKLNGIKGKKTFVPYDKGDKEGNRWWAPTPYYIDWSSENVNFLKENSGKKGEGMPVVRNPQFYFREGFCWTDVNSTYLKSRVKDNGVYDVLTMSLFTKINLPDWYFVCMINSKFISEFVDDFVNSTSHFQINDARQLPIIIPTKEQLKEFESIFNRAVSIQKQKFSKEITEQESENRLGEIQRELDEKVLILYGLK